MAIGNLKVILLLIKFYRIATNKGYATRTLIVVLIALPFLITNLLDFGIFKIDKAFDSFFLGGIKDWNLFIKIIYVLFIFLLKIIMGILYLISGLALLATPVAGIADVYDYFASGR